MAYISAIMKSSGYCVLKKAIYFQELEYTRHQNGYEMEDTTGRALPFGVLESCFSTWSAGTFLSKRIRRFSKHSRSFGTELVSAKVGLNSQLDIQNVPPRFRVT